MKEEILIKNATNNNDLAFNFELDQIDFCKKELNSLT